MIRFLFIFVLILISYRLYSFSRTGDKYETYKSSQNNNGNVIKWADNKLTWENFQGKPELQSKYKAETFTIIKSNPIFYNSDSIIYEISNCFVINKSWTKDNESSRLLSHEQLHFDISELAARRTRKAYSSVKLTKHEITYEKLSRIFKYYSGKYKDSLNSKYDLQTNHGLDSIIQINWERKITIELEGLREYSTERVKVNR
jgi:hypothetical protein